MKREKLTLQNLSDDRFVNSLENAKLKKVFGGMSLITTTTTLPDVTVTSTRTTSVSAASFAALDNCECTGDHAS